MKILMIVVMLLLAAGGYFYMKYLRPIDGMQPTGAYNVGTTSFDVEFDTLIAGGSRKLNIKAWYPSHAGEGELDLQQSPKTALAVVKIFGIPEFLASRDYSASYIDAEIANDEADYPVILFNHGFASFPTQNTVQMQELVSHGYIVLSLAHPKISLMTEYLDGSFVAHDENHPAYKAFAAQSTELEIIGRQLAKVLARAKDTEGFTEYWQVMNEFGHIEIYAALQNVFKQWIEDTNIVVDMIAIGDGSKWSDIIGDKMAGDKIATLGHSLGGVTATFANMANEHIKGSISLDAPPLYIVDKSDLNFAASTCHLMSDVIHLGKNKIDFRQVNRPILQKSAGFGCNATYKGADHLNFTDMNYVALTKLMGQLGKVDQQKMGEELNSMILWYFDRMLKGNMQDYVPLHAEIANIEYFNR